MSGRCSSSGISGSLRRHAHDTALLRAAARLLPSGAALVEYCGLRAVPAFSQPAPGGRSTRSAIRSFRRTPSCTTPE
jgi:NAD(P)H-dependent FMN reductase